MFRTCCLFSFIITPQKLGGDVPFDEILFHYIGEGDQIDKPWCRETHKLKIRWTSVRCISFKRKLTEVLDILQLKWSRSIAEFLERQLGCFEETYLVKAIPNKKASFSFSSNQPTSPSPKSTPEVLRNLEKKNAFHHFQVLFLVVVIAGAHGLWLLPAILSLVGGSKHSTELGSLRICREGMSDGGGC